MLKVEEEMENDPRDLHKRYNVALQYFDNSDYEKSIESLLEILKIDRNWNNKAAHNFLLKIFSYLGSANPITIEGRKKLSKILF